MNLRKVKTGEIEREGDFCFDEDFSYLYVWLPGSTGPDAIAIQKGEQPVGKPRVWGWDGNEDLPTLTPSIHIVNQWHGFIRAGQLVPA